MEQFLASLTVGVIGVLLTNFFTQRAARRQRRQQLISEPLRVYLASVARNVRAAQAGDEQTRLDSGAEILGATGQLVVFGPGELVDALAAFDGSGRNFATMEGQRAFLEVLRVIREEVLPREPELSEAVALSLHFEEPRPGT